MPQEYRVQEAIRLVLQMHKDLRDFYLQAARLTGKVSGEKVFSRLADEIAASIKRYFYLYHGDDLGRLDEFMACGPDPHNHMLQKLTRERWPGMQERRARELSLAQETDIARRLRLTAAQIIDPMARQIMLQAAEATDQHLAVIESEYARDMRMVHETDIGIFVRE